MINGNKLIIATYNIQFSLNLRAIKTNISKMANMDVSLFCLQEVVPDNGRPSLAEILLKELGGEWRAICSLGSESSILGMGNCILWNTRILTLQKEQQELLPKYNNIKFHEKIFSWIAGGVSTSFERRAILGYFKFNDGRSIRVTNVHLDQNGGLKNRRKQLKYLVSILQKNKLEREIICGDFNSFDLLNKGKEAEMQKELLGKDFTDISRNIGWTADLNDVNFNKGGKLLEFLIKKMHIHIRKKIDYIWVKNLKCLECERLLLKGSDHKPLVAYLEV